MNRKIPMLLVVLGALITAQDEVTQTWTYAEPCWTIFYTYKNNHPATAQPVKRICIDFPLGTAGITDIGSPEGWSGFVCPGGSNNCPGGTTPRVCWTTGGPGIAPGAWPLGGFSVKICSGAVPGAQGWSSAWAAQPGGPYAALASGTTILPFQQNRAARRQAAPSGYERVRGQQAFNLFGNPAGQRWQMAYDAGQAEVKAPLTIRTLAWRASNPSATTPAASYDISVTLSTIPDSGGLTSNLNQNVGASPTVVFTGTWTPDPITVPGIFVAEWLPLPLQVPFDWNPLAGDLLIDLSISGITVPLGVPMDAVVGTPLEIGGGLVGNDGTGPSSVATVIRPDLVPIVRLDYDFLVTHQMHQPGALLQLETASNDEASAVVFRTGIDHPTMMLFESLTLSGQPWDLVLGLAPPVSSQSPFGFETPGGQHVNVDLTDPTLFLLNGGNFSSPFVPFGAPILPVAPISLTAQMMVLDPTHPDAFNLSAPNQLVVTPTVATVLSGPTENDGTRTFSTANLGLGPIRVFGHSYDKFSVTSNGRITFGTPDATGIPSFARFKDGHASVGIWTDLDPSLGGQITMAVQPHQVTVLWNNVPLASNPQQQATFSISFDTISGHFFLQGFAQIPQGPQQMIAGASIGVDGPALDQGLLPPFGPVPSTLPPTADNVMIYMQGPLGSPPPLQGANVLELIPQGSGYGLATHP